MKLAWPCVEWSQVPWIAPGSSIPLLWRLLLLPFIHHDWCVFFRLCCCESSLDSVHRRPSLVSNSPLPYWVRRASYQRVLSSGWHRFSPEFTETMTIHSSLSSCSIATVQQRFEYKGQALSNTVRTSIVWRWEERPLDIPNQADGTIGSDWEELDGRCFRSCCSFPMDRTQIRWWFLCAFLRAHLPTLSSLTFDSNVLRRRQVLFIPV